MSAHPASLVAYDEWLLRGRSGTWIAHRVRSVREQADALVAQLDGVESREAAGALRGAEIGVPRESLPPPGKDEYYQADLVGMAVLNREGVALGALADFVDSGAHPIARVVADDGAERLIPWVSLYIDAVDVNGRRIDVDWPADA